MAYPPEDAMWNNRKGDDFCLDGVPWSSAADLGCFSARGCEGEDASLSLVRTRELKTHSALRVPFESPPLPSHSTPLLPSVASETSQVSSLPEHSEEGSFSHLFVQTPLSSVPGRATPLSLGGSTDPGRSRLREPPAPASGGILALARFSCVAVQ